MGIMVHIPLTMGIMVHIPLTMGNAGFLSSTVVSRLGFSGLLAVWGPGALGFWV